MFENWDLMARMGMAIVVIGGLVIVLHFLLRRTGEVKMKASSKNLVLAGLFLFGGISAQISAMCLRALDAPMVGPLLWLGCLCLWLSLGFFVCAVLAWQRERPKWR